MKLKRKSMVEKDKWISYELRENKWTIWEKVKEKIKFVCVCVWERERERFIQNIFCAQIYKGLWWCFYTIEWWWCIAPRRSSLY
jgi:hypothetical protein